ncbi:hypothetical protein RhiirC2_826223 [Rhizophagus irregularis]|uniref:Uncharacterized protein n=1 Tax=Rhizophagus irregularis TaxID=588596 RepID=A0A2N1M6N6_9GLOM|nr:hypothetical protein RhiirC2_826223 [Rhizophagus irregularis]
MFDSRLSYRVIKEKFRWQAVQRLDVDAQNDDVQVIKDFIRKYDAFFGKIIRVNRTRFIILYFIKEEKLMNAINESIKNNDLGKGLWIKKESDYIDENGDLQESNRRSDYIRDASRANSFRMEWEQQSGPSTRFAPSRRHNQWRINKFDSFCLFLMMKKCHIN